MIHPPTRGSTSMNSNIVLLSVVCGALFVGCASIAGQEAPSVRVRMTKDRYGMHEPIGINMVFNNPTDQPLLVPLGAPGFVREFLYGLIKFKPKDENIAVREEFAGLHIFNYRVSQYTIQPKEHLEAVVYIQRFYQQPSVGPHIFSFSFQPQGYLKSANNEKPIEIIKAEGDLKFSVFATDRKQQRGMLEALVKQIREKKNLYDIEALSVVDDAVVIPFLGKLAADPQGLHVSSIYDAINRFGHDKKALALVIEAVDSKEPCLSPIEILTLLCYWKYPLSAEQIRRLRMKGNSAVEAKVQEYIKLMDEELKKTH
jgi:hypothetical protein